MTKLDTFIDFILPDQQIRISTFDRVNDPFELLGKIKNGNKRKHAFSSLREFWTKNYGFISFSNNWRSPLMWAHYGNNHTGVCLGIDVEVTTPIEIKYLPKRTISNYDFSGNQDAENEKLLHSLATTKFEEWSYEKEWRIFRKLDSTSEFSYEKFTPEFELREIILGARCNKSIKEIAESISTATNSIEIKKARPAFRTFEMVNNYRNNCVTVHPNSDNSIFDLKSQSKTLISTDYFKKYYAKN